MAGGAYREPQRTPPRRIALGPFAPSPRALAFVVLLATSAVSLIASAELSAEVECWRTETGAPPQCVRRARPLASPDTVVASPASLVRAGPSGNAPPAGAWIDELRFDGITVMLPNNPPGPLTIFLETPESRRVRMHDGVSVPVALPAFVVVLLAFFLPRVVIGLAPRRLLVDRAAGELVIGTRWPRAVLRVALEQLARVRVEHRDGSLFERVEGARVVLELVDGTEVPLTPFARPPRAAHLAAARALATELALPEVLSRASPTVPISPPTGGRVLAVQLAGAAVALVLVTVWLVRLSSG